MCSHKSRYNTNKTVKYVAKNPRHKNAVPYKRAEKHKASIKDYQ